MDLIAEIDACCGPLVGAPLPASEAERVAEVFKALGDPARLRLVSLIAARPEKEACVCELVEPLGLKQPTISHHLKVLTDCGLLERERRASWVYYRVRPEALRVVAGLLSVEDKPSHRGVVLA